MSKEKVKDGLLEKLPFFVVRENDDHDLTVSAFGPENVMK